MRSRSAHEIAEESGLTRDRLSAALSANDNWGAMVHAFEFLTAASALLASWPDDEGGAS